MLRSMLLAYDEEGEVIATLDYMVAHDDEGEAVGLVDFAAHEETGGALTDVWQVDTAIGSATWPEWIGGQAHDFRVEVDPAWSRSKPAGERPPGRIRALVHKTSGYRRERAAIEAAVAEKAAALGATIDRGASSVIDLRELVGRPDQPLTLDESGRTIARRRSARTAATLPRIGGEAAQEGLHTPGRG